MAEDNTQKLKRSATWKLGVTIILTGILDWTYLSGPAVEKVGAWAPLAWISTVVAIAVICYCSLEILLMFPNKAGGLATCIIEGFKKRHPIFAVISQWGYVTGWGLAVGAIAAFASYFIKYFIEFPDAYINYVAIGILTGVFLINLISIEIIEKLQSLIFVLFGLTVMVIAGAFIKLPMLSPDFSGVQINASDTNPAAVFLSACFLVGWSACAMEAVLTLIAEYKQPEKDTKKALSSSAAVMLVMTLTICGAMTWYLPLDVVLNDPYTPLLPLAETIYGSMFARIFGFCLIVGLVIGANACFLPASRVLFEASRSGLMPKCFGKLNKNQVPFVAILSIYAVNFLFLMTTGGEQPTFMVVAGGISYFLMVFFAGLAVPMMRKDFPDLARPYKTPNLICALSVVASFFFLTLLIAGTIPYGLKNCLYGIGATLVAIPLYWYRVHVEDKREAEPIQDSV
ncbi:APC family permease [Desulforhopalus singaporensis]|uniref:Amino acid transporter n=1 Tax=Desulforhopalus singaporensis TaxID=91360 RepID=A0A1H0T5H6_9BACT|nr:APC family permease [Desulforhopalus singaporensis]SDP49303.1 Amino acid transporter [Desulforhopalus singaporensis]